MKKAPTSIRVLRGLLVLLKWFSVLGFALAIVLVGRSVFVDGGGDGDSTFFAYASDLDASAFSVTSDDGRTGTVEIEKAWVTLRFPNEESGVVVWSALLVLVMIGGVLGLFWALIAQLKGILDTVESGNPFVEENANRARKIGLILLVGTLGEMIVVFAVSGFADINFRPVGMNFNGHLGVDFVGLIASLSAFAIAEVFRVGLRMKQEQDLTI